MPLVKLSEDALEFLSRLSYPGNIRELKNLVERTLLVCGKDCLTAEDFQSQYHPASVATDSVANAKGLTLEELEKRTILQALDTHDNNLTQVALSLGISRAALYRRLEKYGISFND